MKPGHPEGDGLPLEGRAILEMLRERLRVEDEKGSASPRRIEAGSSSGSLVAGNAEQLKIPGTGVGLASVRSVVAQHGGSVSLESEEGEWTAVTVRLPKRTPRFESFGAAPEIAPESVER